MNPKFRFGLRFLNHYLTAHGTRGHGIHSPFLYDFVLNVLKDRSPQQAFSEISSLRKALFKDDSILHLEDLGAGQSEEKNSARSVASIISRSAVSENQGKFLFRMSQHYRPRSILELGTSLGLSACYLSSGNPEAQVMTIEGASAAAMQAERNFRKLGLENVLVHVGGFDEVLPFLIKQPGSIDMAYIDGNHRKEPTLNYVNFLIPHMSSSSVIILHDIHWSREMEDAWETILEDRRLLLTVDLFFFGLIFFREDFRVKQHFSIRFPTR